MLFVVFFLCLLYVKENLMSLSFSAFDPRLSDSSLSPRCLFFFSTVQDLLLGLPMSQKVEQLALAALPAIHRLCSLSRAGPYQLCLHSVPPSLCSSVSTECSPLACLVLLLRTMLTWDGNGGHIPMKPYPPFKNNGAQRDWMGRGERWLRGKWGWGRSLWHGDALYLMKDYFQLPDS